MAFLHLLSSLSLLTFLILSPTTTSAQATLSPEFKCTAKTTCTALVGYVSPNKTTLGHIQTLFQVPSLLSLTGANGLPPSTAASHTVSAQSTVKIPVPCRCSNGTGTSDQVPNYVVVKDDFLFHIASDIFGGLVTYPQIQKANKIKDPSLIYAGQKLWIPLPCSCDDVGGRPAVHYAHVVAAKSSIGEIAAEFGTSEQELMSLNGITDPKKLMAGQVLDVPILACSSTVKNNSADFPLIVANKMTVYTANDCVSCSCNAMNNYTLHCHASGLNPTTWSTCPSSKCSSDMPLGMTFNTRCQNSSCNYAGFTKSQILTDLAVVNTCHFKLPNGAWKIHQSRWSWAVVLLSIQFLMIHGFL